MHFIATRSSRLCSSHQCKAPAPYSGMQSTELATGFQSALPSRDRAEIVIDSTTYELPFTYNNYDYDSSGDYVDPAAKGSPCLPSYLTSMQWYLPKYKVRATAGFLGCECLVKRVMPPCSTPLKARSSHALFVASCTD